MKERDIIEALPDALRRCLSDVPFVRLVNVEANSSLCFDAEARLEVKNRPKDLIIEVTASGQPKSIREAARRLAEATDGQPDAYSVVVAPYISDEGAAVASEAGIGYADLAGNCRLSFAGVYVRESGKSNPFAKKRELAGLYSPKASRILRAMLEAPQRAWRLVPLTEGAGVSLGLASGARRRLIEREWAEETPEGLRLVKPEALLRDWAAHYSYRDNKTGDLYSARPLTELETDLAFCCREAGIDCWLAGFSAARLLAPNVRYTRAMAYVQGGWSSLMASLELRRVDSGANLTFLQAEDEGVFIGAKRVYDLPIVSPVQTFLDLAGYKGRGEEAAEEVLRKVILPRW